MGCSCRLEAGSPHAWGLGEVLRPGESGSGARRPRVRGHEGPLPHSGCRPAHASRVAWGQAAGSALTARAREPGGKEQRKLLLTGHRQGRFPPGWALGFGRVRRTTDEPSLQGTWGAGSGSRGQALPRESPGWPGRPPSVQPAQLGRHGACTRLNGDSWPEGDLFAAWSGGERMRRVPRWPGARGRRRRHRGRRGGPAGGGGGGQCCGQWGSDGDSWARPRQWGGEDRWRPGDEEPETLSWGRWARRRVSRADGATAERMSAGSRGGRRRLGRVQ